MGATYGVLADTRTVAGTKACASTAIAVVGGRGVGGWVVNLADGVLVPGVVS